MEEIKELGQVVEKEIYGRKAFWLNWLYGNKIRVPRAIFLPAMNYENIMDQIQNPKFMEKMWYHINKKLKRCNRFAVRSSALDEDGEYSSMAGSYTSFLDIDSDHLVDAISEVLKEARGNKIGIIVQEMIDSTSGGVLFSSNPLNAKKNQININMVNGKNQNLMEGFRTGESLIYNVDKWIKLPHYQVNIDKLNLYKLLMKSRYTEKKAARPVDIEWCISRKKNRLYFLQCRPVTGIFPKQDGIYKVHKKMCGAVPEFLMLSDKVQLRLEAQKLGIPISDAFLLACKCVEPEIPVKTGKIPRSDKCRGYSVVMTFPKRDKGKVLRSFVGNSEAYVEEEMDVQSEIIRVSPYETIDDCLRDYYKRIQGKYWACSVIIQEIYEPLYTGSLCRLPNGYVIEIGKGHFLPKGAAPISRYLCDMEGNVTYSKEVPCWSYKGIVEGNVIQYTCNPRKPKWIRIAEDAVTVIVNTFQALADEGTIIEFGLLKSEKCQPYLIDCTREKGKIDMTAGSLREGVISKGRRTGKLVFLQSDLGNQALEMHLYNEMSSQDIHDEACIFYAEMPGIEFAGILNKYDPGSIGFVFKEGSALCHFSLLLREKGIPAITGFDGRDLKANGCYRLDTESKEKLLEM
ncbi:MAG: PEP/pyruvate-binding domain-containing protein [Clostridiales bacterium]|nr:PEP/pyruvate-binding domain-containing protein [Clostridiales bacterium]